MGKLTIGYDNLIDASGVVPTHSTEVAEFEAENVQAVQPSEKFRTSALSPGYLHADLPGGKPVDMVAMLGHSASPFNNLLRWTSDIDNGVWTQNNLDGASANVSARSKAGSGTRMDIVETTDGGATIHYLEQAYTKPVAALPSPPNNLTVRCWAEWSDIASGRGIELRVFGAGAASDFAFVRVDLNDGSTIDSGDLGDFTLNSVENVAGSLGARRITMQFNIGVDATATITTRITMLDDSGPPPTNSYTGTGEGISVYGLQLAWGDTAPAYTETDAVNGATWATHLTTSDWTPFAVGGTNKSGVMMATMGGSDSTERNVGAYFLWATQSGSGTWSGVDLHDPNNADSQIDIGRVYIGPVWQGTLQNGPAALEIQHVRNRRIFQIGIAFATEAEAYGEALELARILDIGRASQQMEMMGGQIIRPRQKPVIVIIDPDETDFPQEQMIYGFVNQLRLRFVGPGTINGVEYPELYSIRLEIEEVIA